MIVIKKVIAILRVQGVMLIVTERQRLIRQAEPFTDLPLLRFIQGPQVRIHHMARLWHRVQQATTQHLVIVHAGPEIGETSLLQGKQPVFRMVPGAIQPSYAVCICLCESRLKRDYVTLIELEYSG